MKIHPKDFRVREGKDGAIKHVMSGVNPQGCQVFSFKHPTATELQHDFLWRTTRDLPERGRIGIVNRSYYEEALIARVHPEILLNEDIPDAKQHARLIVSRIVLDTLEALDMAYPVSSDERREELLAIRRELAE